MLGPPSPGFDLRSKEANSRPSLIEVVEDWLLARWTKF